MSPLYDFTCVCGNEIEVLCKMDEGVVCSKCLKPMKRVCNCRHFKLVYDNKRHVCDWSGNSSNYWNDVKAARARGEDVH